MTQLTNDYNRILKSIWSSAPDGINNVWPEDAIKAVKALFKREFPEREWPYEIKFTSGNRYTWVRRTLGKDGRYRGGRTVFINCEKGAGLERAEKRLKSLDRDIRAYSKKYEKRLA
jgi:hypothetical protein